MTFCLIVAYKGDTCNQRGFPMGHLIIGKMYAKTQVPYSRGEKVISLDEVISFLMKTSYDPINPRFSQTTKFVPLLSQKGLLEPLYPDLEYSNFLLQHNSPLKSLAKLVLQYIALSLRSSNLCLLKFSLDMYNSSELFSSCYPENKQV